MLSPAKKRQLRASAHKLKPVILLGQKGLSTAVHAEIENALLAHELIKIRLNGDNKDAKKEITESICDKHSAELVQSIGHIIAIFREKPAEGSA